MAAIACVLAVAAAVYDVPPAAGGWHEASSPFAYRW
jgi:hypothetical protein